MSRAYSYRKQPIATCRLRQRLRDRNRSRSQGWMLSDTRRPVRPSPGLGELELRRTVMRWPSRPPKGKILPLLSGKSSSCGFSAARLRTSEQESDCDAVRNQATACSATFGESEKVRFPSVATSTSMTSPAWYAPRRTCSAKGFSRLFWIARFSGRAP